MIWEELAVATIVIIGLSTYIYFYITDDYNKE